MLAGVSFAAEKFFQTGDFIIVQACQRRAFAGDAGSGADIDQLFAVDFQFFGERIDPSGQSAALPHFSPARRIDVRSCGY